MEKRTPRTQGPALLQLLNDDELSCLLGRQVVLWLAARRQGTDWLVNSAGLDANTLEAVLQGRGMMRDLVAEARALEVMPDLLDAMRPRPRTLDELERVESARLDVNVGGAHD